MKVLNQFKRYIFLVLVLANSTSIIATHGTTGSITYRCIDTNIGRYEITLNVVRQCVGVSLGNEELKLHSAQLNTTILMGSPTIKEITPVCKVPDVSVPVVTNCPSGPITNISGSEKWTYKTTVVLGKNLGWALIGWGTCCRQGTLSTISGAGGQGIWIQAAINTNVINSSPIFNSDATNFVCFNKENWFDLSAKDSFDPRYIVIDGNYIERDSLVYELYAPFTAQAANINNSINLQESIH